MADNASAPDARAAPPSASPDRPRRAATARRVVDRSSAPPSAAPPVWRWCSPTTAGPSSSTQLRSSEWCVGRDGATALGHPQRGQLARPARPRRQARGSPSLEASRPARSCTGSFNHFVVFERVARQARHRASSTRRWGAGASRATEFCRSVHRRRVAPRAVGQRSSARRRTGPARRSGVRSAASSPARAQWPRILVVVAAPAAVRAGAAAADRRDRRPRGPARRRASARGHRRSGSPGAGGFHFLSSMVRAHLLLHLRTIFDSRMTLELPRSPAAAALRLLPAARDGRSDDAPQQQRHDPRDPHLGPALGGARRRAGEHLPRLFFFASPPFGLLVFDARRCSSCGVLWFSRRRQRELIAARRCRRKRARRASSSRCSPASRPSRRSAPSCAPASAGRACSSTSSTSRCSARGSTRSIDALNGVLKIGSPLVMLVFGAMQVLDGTMSLGTMLALCALAGAFLAPLGKPRRHGDAAAAARQLPRAHRRRLRAPRPSRRRTVRAWSPRCAAASRSRTSASATRRARRRSCARCRSTSRPATSSPSSVARARASRRWPACCSGSIEPTSGRILYDGVELGGLDLRSLRQQVGIVNQRAYLFGASVRANIAMSDPELPLATSSPRPSCAHIDAEIRAMPMGYETVLLDGGASLVGRSAPARRARPRAGAAPGDPAARRGDERARRAHRARRAARAWRSWCARAS